MNRLIISASPHTHDPKASLQRCMWDVVAALTPALLVSLWYFGWQALWVTAVAIGSCMLFEWAITRYMLGRRTSTLANGSALLTGLLLAFNLPSSLPWWTVALGSLAAIGIGKMSFGGLGCNIFNPALVGRVFLLLSFPVAMTTWPIPGNPVAGYADGTSGATILAQIKQGLIDYGDVSLMAQMLGDEGGSMGEVGSLALLLGGAYLLWRRVITWHIPAAILASAALFAWLIGANPLVELLAGGMLLGAIFMATDYVTSPMTPGGMLIYGVLIGVVTIVIRHWGAYPEGMSFAILLMNGLTPLINRLMRPVRFGQKSRRIAA